MKWVQFVVESLVKIIQSLAWPAVALVCFFVIRKPLIALLQRVKKVGKGDWFAELGKDEINEMAKKAEKVNLMDVTNDTLVWDNYLNVLEQWAYWLGWYVNAVRLIKDSGMSALNMSFSMNLIPAIRLILSILKKLEKERPTSEMLPRLISMSEDIKEKFPRIFSAVEKTRK